ncbi:class I SAM-dependent methyltransferase [Syntrophorhabdus aromaticivorans]|uniref:Class I SAM-dependent methyltransferase n=1 Tax=Syntrophorhabdus aromaticivorans TaxID=328301 RepID=A0A351U479_9BACT|nr:class I SAM-dependent methyltransferase [Syntrophorhabdus aromaticivorans]NLW34408.1 class I SAM-dependent methyltransferase [Syntrophorhabdus aromaticivorans]HBA54760.1 class I SAM-dependent methyltransferase [Syntrophorhabdus aromaticivorans]
MESRSIEEFDRIAREVFAPVYPSIAGQIVAGTGITKGRCLDIGTGGGYLGIALAKITDLDILLLDKSREMLDIASRNVMGAGLETRLRVVSGDVHDIPLEDESINLVVSRGSVFMWNDKARAFREIYRVLCPGGTAYVGGGLGSPGIRRQIEAKMKENGRDWPDQKRIAEDRTEMYRQGLQDAGIAGCSVTKSDVGTWIQIHK